ncbi:MAG TPA: S8 family serine peptidase [Solirubrobacteraceae bacterium]|nr:S8 family serine peptidase [Solirubrobacteraceae bacterium]
MGARTRHRQQGRRRGIAALAAAVAASSLLAAAPAGGAVEDEVVVRFRPGTSADQRASARGAAGVRLRRALRLPRAQLLHATGRGGVPAALRRLRRDPAVLYAEPNRRVRAVGAPNDPLLPGLWGLVNTGQAVGGFPGLPGADIGALAAWQVSTGSRDVLVAVADTGVVRGHEDLAANMWTNPAEPVNGADDDGNGLVDDVRGWDFVHDDGDPDEVYVHGTHVAGTIGAVGDNAIGVTGVAQRVSLVGVKVLGDDGNGSSATIAEGLAYAASLGADVVNMSFGGFGRSQLVADAIAAAPATLFVAASGNDGADVDARPFTPCSEPGENLVCVAATDQRDRLTYFSNHGRATVDLAAPGWLITSTVPGGYATSYGTSMAAPHVAGAAALLAAAHPGEGPVAWRARLLQGVDRVRELQGATVTGGRLDVGSSVRRPADGPPAAALAVAPDPPAARTRMVLDASASGGGGAVARYRWDLDGDERYELATADLRVMHVVERTGPATVGVQVVDERGGTRAVRRALDVAAPPAGTPDVAMRVDPAAPPVGTPATLTAVRAAGSPEVVRYEWDLDGDWTYERDGGGEPAVEHAFARPGTVTVGVRATGPGGTVAEARARVRVAQSPPVARLSMNPPAPLPGELVTFDAGESSDADGRVDAFRWDVTGDGEVDLSGPDPRVAWRYGEPGPRTVTVWAQDDDGQAARAGVTFTVGEAAGLVPDGPPRIFEREGEADGDGVIEPGEGLTVEQDVRNASGETIRGLRGAVRAGGDDAAGAGEGAWPDLAPGASAAPSAPVAVDTYASAGCGRPIELELVLAGDRGRTVIPLAVPTGHAGPKVPYAGDAPFRVPPRWWAAVGLGAHAEGGVKDVDVRLDELRHAGDLVVAVRGPRDGHDRREAVALAALRGDFVGTVFDDEAPTPVGGAEPPYAGRFRPEQPLSRFDGREAGDGFALEVENRSDTEAAGVERAGVDLSVGECDDRRANRRPVVPWPTAVPDPALAGEPVTLAVSGAADPDGRIESYRWDLDGDGDFEHRTAEPRLTFVPRQGGSYRYRVMAVDDRRAGTAVDGRLHVHASAPPVAAFTVEPSFTEAGRPVRLDASGSHDFDGRIVSWSWEADGELRPVDGGEAAEAVFATPGWVLVRLTVEDDSGTTSSTDAYVLVKEPGAPELPAEEPEEPGPAPEPPDGPAPGTDAPPGAAPPLAGAEGAKVAPLRAPPGAATPLAGAERSPLGTLPGPAAPPAPLVVSAPLRLRAASLRAGLPLRAQCAKACSLTAELRIGRAAARRLGLWPRGRRGPSLALARRTALLDAGDPALLRLRVEARVRAAVARAGTVRAQVVTTARRPGEPPSVARHDVTLTR